MKLAIASGKGGTGKTTVAVNLAKVASRTGEVLLLDCDVEEPNAHLFLRPRFHPARQVTNLVPEVDEEKCTGCGKCAEICQYNAIAVLKNTPLVYTELCHSCGGCAAICPESAIREVPRAVGVIEQGSAGEIAFAHGRLNVGVSSATPLIDAVKQLAGGAALTLIDSPPGTACAMTSAVHGVDYALLVTEPTPFGLHDLELAVDTLRQMDIPFGVAINRDGMGDDRVDVFCEREKIEILGRIADDRRIAEAYSRGELAVEALPELEALFDALLEKAVTRASDA